MKNIKFLTLILLLLAKVTIAQTIYKGKIVDNDNLPLAGVSILSTANNKKGTASDFDGNFTLKLDDPKVKVSFVGFKTEIVTLTSGINKIVLKEDAQNLEEVIISASREAQQRKDVPGAIGIMSAKDIEETKAFGIDQIVNQVPGVYMSTSPSASNEQHMMAIRTPISTKALFLYLEDGLPIRPVAVFNHNALLEMNSTAFGRVEVLKGPASSIYGSEAIGGSMNFITENPRKEFGGAVSLEANTLGLQKVEAEVSTTALDKYGFYVGAHKVRRVNGLIEHSDYEKFAITFKNVNDFNENLRWTNAVSFIDFRSDMGSSSLSEENYLAGKYKSEHTFAERQARTLRFRSTIDKKWNENNKTSLNVIYRDNEMNQIPSYRIKLNKKLNKYFGETNSNKFQSIVGLIQHKIDFNIADASLIIGGTVDYSPQEYQAIKTKVTYDQNTKKYTDYELIDGFTMLYEADILNYATYVQFEVSPIENLKFTTAIRYDAFSYDYDNKDEGNSGVEDQKVIYDNISPKVGLNFNFNSNSGIYTNYSKGFTPPQIGSLFRNKSSKIEADGLKPAIFDNYEIGGYAKIAKDIKVDVALYRLDGKDRFITITDENGEFSYQNAGKTRSQGVELGLNWKILKNLEFDYNGSYATHQYITFFEEIKSKGKVVGLIDRSNTDMQIAPNYIASMSLKYRPITDLLLTLQHEQIGKYNSSFENGAVVGKDTSGNSIKGTTVYDGHHLFNLKASYTYKNFEFWAQGLNLFDKLYSTRTSYRYGRNSYSVGAPFTFHGGVKYNF